MKALGLAALLLVWWAAPGLCAGYDELNAGIEARNRQDWDSAIAHLSSALAAGDLISDQQYVAHLDRGDAYLSKGERDAAIADYSACIILRPDDSEALLYRGALYADAGDPQAAARDLDAALALDPRNPVTLMARANFFEIEGEPDKELAALQEIAADQGAEAHDKAINLYLGIAKLQMGDTNAAAAIFAQSPGDPITAWLWLAITELKQGKSLPAGGQTFIRTPPWPDPVVQFYHGKLTEEALRAKIAGAPQIYQQGMFCETDFYIGEWRSLHNDPSGAATLFHKAAEGCPRNFIERQAALAELKNAH